MTKKKEQEPEVVQVEQNSHAGCPLESACAALADDVLNKLSHDEQVAMIAAKNLFCFLMQRDADVLLDVFGNISAQNSNFFPVYLKLAMLINQNGFKCARRRSAMDLEKEEAADSAVG